MCGIFSVVLCGDLYWYFVMEERDHVYDLNLILIVVTLIYSEAKCKLDSNTKEVSVRKDKERLEDLYSCLTLCCNVIIKCFIIF